MGEVQKITGDEAYVVSVKCPACGGKEAVGLLLNSRLEQVAQEAKLGLKVKAGKRDHRCGQTAIVSETGEIVRIDLNLDLDGDDA